MITVGRRCECCDRFDLPDEKGWHVGFDGEDLCPECARPVLEQRQELIEKLPGRLGLCPVHADEFYYPLRDGEGLVCPVCPTDMIVYTRCTQEVTLFPGRSCPTTRLKFGDRGQDEPHG